MRGIGFLFTASRVRLVKCNKCYSSSDTCRRLMHILCRREELSLASLSDSINMNYFNIYIGRCLSFTSRKNNAASWLNLKKFRGLYFVISDNTLSVPVVTESRCVIHTSSVLLSDSLGADSTGLTSAKSAKEQFEKWKASIDFDLLTEAHMRIHNAHMKAVEEKRETYTDPVSDFEVFTIMTHLLRGSCCGNVCRHCPYGHVNAPKEYKEHMRYNTAFYY